MGGEQVKKLLATLTALYALLLPALIAAENEPREDCPPAVAVPAPSHEVRETSAPAPAYSIEEQISAINAGYAQMYESDVEPVPTAPAPTARYPLTDEERSAVERMVASEGGYCDYKFQALVTECILNGCEADGLRPTELFARGDFWLTHDVAPTDTTKQAVSDVFDYGIFPTAEKVRYYYNPTYCDSPAHESKCYVLTECGCRFFKDWG